MSKVFFLSRGLWFFSSSPILTIYKSQIRPSLEYCSHICGGAQTSTICFLNKVQLKLFFSSFNLFQIFSLLEIFPSFTDTIMDIALRRSEVKFLLLCGILGPINALPAHIICLFHYIIAGAEALYGSPWPFLNLFH